MRTLVMAWCWAWLALAKLPAGGAETEPPKSPVLTPPAAGQVRDMIDGATPLDNTLRGDPALLVEVVT